MKNIRINYLDPQSKQKIQRILQSIKLIYETEGYAAHNATHYLIWTNYNPKAAYNIIQNNGGHFQNKPQITIKIHQCCHRSLLESKIIRVTL